MKSTRSSFFVWGCTSSPPWRLPGWVLAKSMVCWRFREPGSAPESGEQPSFVPSRKGRESIATPAVVKPAATSPAQVLMPRYRGAMGYRNFGLRALFDLSHCQLNLRIRLSSSGSSDKSVLVRTGLGPGFSTSLFPLRSRAQETTLFIGMDKGLSFLPRLKIYRSGMVRIAAPIGRVRAPKRIVQPH